MSTLQVLWSGPEEYSHFEMILFSLLLSAGTKQAFSPSDGSVLPQGQ